MTMKSVWGRLVRRPLKTVRPKSPEPRPYGFREERIVSDIADTQARTLLMSVRTDGTTIWTGEGLDTSGIVMSAREREVLDMIRDRVIARVRHHVNASILPDGTIQAEPALMSLIEGDKALAAARRGAVHDLKIEILNVSKRDASRLIKDVLNTGNAVFDPDAYSPRRTLPWPHQGWDRDSLVLASKLFMTGLRAELLSAGYELEAQTGNGKLNVRRSENQHDPAALS